QCIQAVMLARQGPLHSTLHSTIEQHIKTAIGMRRQRPSLRIPGTEPFDPAPATTLQYTLQRRFTCISNHATDTRNSTHQVMELGFDCLQIGEDIGVIVFEIVENRSLGAVMDKLAALVEERRIVLISLDYKERGCFATTRQ